MTVTDRLRAAVPGAGTSSGTGPGWRRAAVVGGLTGLVSVGVVVGPVLAAWSQAVPSAGTVEEALAVGAGLWLLTAGAHVGVDGAVLSLTPLLGLVLLVLLARLGAREAMVRVSLEGPSWWGLLPRRLAQVLGAWWAGYAVVVVVAAAVAATGPLRPLWSTIALPAVVLPLLAGGLALRSVVADDPDVLGPRAAVAWIPIPSGAGWGRA